MKVRLTFTEELLGTASADPEIHAEFIASKGPDAKTLKEEVAALGEDEVVEKSKTIFARDADGDPSLWDYQIKGMFKDACGMLIRATGTKSSSLTAYKKIIDGLVFVLPRQIKIVLPKGGQIGNCQRPLRAQTAQGERIALAHSETVPAGSVIEFEIDAMDLSKGKVPLAECIEEWLNYGAKRGLGQWRNSGKGRFTWELLK
jgi:hypothetical protein